MCRGVFVCVWLSMSLYGCFSELCMHVWVCVWVCVCVYARVCVLFEMTALSVSRQFIHEGHPNTLALSLPFRGCLYVNTDYLVATELSSDCWDASQTQQGNQINKGATTEPTKRPLQHKKEKRPKKNTSADHPLLFETNTEIPTSRTQNRAYSSLWITKRKQVREKITS